MNVLRKKLLEKILKNVGLVQIDSFEDSQVTEDILPKKFKYVHKSDLLQIIDNVSVLKKRKRQL